MLSEVVREDGVDEALLVRKPKLLWVEVQVGSSV